MFIAVSQAESRSRLLACGYSFVGVMNDAIEVWRSGAGSEIMLTPEFDNTGCYEEETIKSPKRRSATAKVAPGTPGGEKAP